MDIVGEVHGYHFHVVPPFVILGDIAHILLEGMVHVKNFHPTCPTTHYARVRCPQERSPNRSQTKLSLLWIVT